MNGQDVNLVWLKLLRDLIGQGKRVSPRGRDCLELMGYETIVPMMRPLVTVRARRLNYQFAAAEALWILSGSNRLEPLLKYAPSYHRFSDDGVTLAGAYGPYIVNQTPYVVNKLNEDHYTRQAVIGIWRDSPAPSFDIPCTLSLQFIIRDRKLHTVVSMRSSDAWLGWPYDIFSFSMVTLDIMRRLSDRLELGNLILHVGSQHLYMTDLEKMRHGPVQVPLLSGGVPPEMIGEYQDIISQDVISPDHLRTCLGYLRDMPDDQSNTDIPLFFRRIREIHDEIHK